MKDPGLLLIMENKGHSCLCASLFEYLDSDERDRAFELVEDQNIEQIIAEERKRKSHSVTEIMQIKSQENKHGINKR